MIGLKIIIHASLCALDLTITLFSELRDHFHFVVQYVFFCGHLVTISSMNSAQDTLPSLLRSNLEINSCKSFSERKTPLSARIILNSVRVRQPFESLSQAQNASCTLKSGRRARRFLKSSALSSIVKCVLKVLRNMLRVSTVKKCVRQQPCQMWYA